MKMTTIEFDTPTLNEKGEIIGQTRHRAEQFTEDLEIGISLEMILFQRVSSKWDHFLTREMLMNSHNILSPSSHS